MWCCCFLSKKGLKWLLFFPIYIYYTIGTWFTLSKWLVQMDPDLHLYLWYILSAFTSSWITLSGPRSRIFWSRRCRRHSYCHGNTLLVATLPLHIVPPGTHSLPLLVNHKRIPPVPHYLLRVWLSKSFAR